jgi:plastocyanin
MLVRNRSVAKTAGRMAAEGWRAGRRAAVLPATVLACALVACGGGGGDATEDQTEAPSADAAEPVAIADPATIQGVINFAGTPAAEQPIDMSEEPTCADKHAEPVTPRTVVAEGGKLANVFVRITEGLPDGTGGSAPAEPVHVDQEGCIYIPHVVGVMLGQGVTFENSDGILHNVRASPANNRPINISQPTNMMSPEQNFSAEEVMIPVQCDVHGWMQMYIGVVDNPYFAVSGEDGTFTIANLPAGTYTVETWHEKYGTQTQQVTVAANETAQVTFDYNASMAGRPVPMGDPIDPHGDHAHPPARAVGALH